MSWTDQEISEMAKAAQAEQKFAYQDTFWDEVEAMLPKKKKKSFPFFALGIIPLLGTLGFLATAPLQIVTADQGVKRLEPIHSNWQIRRIGSMETDGSSVKKDYLAEETVAFEKPTHASKERQISIAAPSRIQAENVVAQMQTTSGISNALQRTASSTPNMAGDQDVSAKNNATLGTELILESKKSTLKMDEIPVERENSPRVQSTDRLAGEYTIDRLLFNSITAFDLKKDITGLPVLARKLRPYWNGYLETGYSMGQNYMYTEAAHTRAFSFGGGMRRNFSGYFLQMGLAGEIQNVKLELSEREKIYHTSSSDFENRFSYKEVYRIQAPFTLGYNLKNHVFQMNLVPAYLYGAKMKYAYLENGVTLRDETIYGVTKGWNRFSASFGFGYGYQIVKTVTLGGNFNWQMVNQINKNMVNDGNVRPFSGQVFFRKTLK